MVYPQIHNASDTVGVNHLATYRPDRFLIDKTIRPEMFVSQKMTEKLKRVFHN